MSKTSTHQHMTIYTIGHSTHPIREFLDMLAGQQIALVADIRTIPRSRHNPQFDQEALRAVLAENGIAYGHLKNLGGLRHPQADSPNRGWRNASFRGFADYMQTRDFQEGLAELIELGARQQTVLMCAEAVPWRCHRSLVSDALLVRGIPVEHITGKSRSQAHRLTPFAKVEGLKITYPEPVPAK